MGDKTHVSGGIWLKLRNLLLEPIQQAAARPERRLIGRTGQRSSAAR